MFRVHRQSEQPHLHSPLLVTGSHTQNQLKQTHYNPRFTDRVPEIVTRHCEERQSIYESQQWGGDLKERRFFTHDIQSLK